MIGPYTYFELTLSASEPVRPGNGDQEDFTKPDGTIVTRSVIQCGAGGTPFIAGSSIKGALRSLARRINLEQTNALFGPEKISEADDARSSQITCWTAFQQTMPANPITDARTTINPSNGVAEDHRLFHQEIIPAGTVFLMRIGLTERADSDAQTLLETLFAAISGPGGITFGGGSGGGAGRFTGNLDSLKATRHGIDPAIGDEDVAALWRERIRAAAPAPTGICVQKIRLACDGPFISLDNLALPKHGSSNILQALREPAQPNCARLTGASLRGALRARAVWLERLKDNNHRDNRDLVLDRKGSAAVTDLTAPGAVCQTISSLSTTELMFGVNGWRGLLAIRELRNDKAEDTWTTIHSVKLDRFSGAPITGGLFSVLAAIDPVFTANLELDEYRLQHAPSQAKALNDLLERLIKNLGQSGLMLGHGANRGYGWFNVEPN